MLRLHPFFPSPPVPFACTRRFPLLPPNSASPQTFFFSLQPVLHFASAGYPPPLSSWMAFFEVDCVFSVLLLCYRVQTIFSVPSVPRSRLSVSCARLIPLSTFMRIATYLILSSPTSIVPLLRILLMPLFPLDSFSTRQRTPHPVTVFGLSIPISVRGFVENFLCFARATILMLFAFASTFIFLASLAPGLCFFLYSRCRAL